MDGHAQDMFSMMVKTSLTSYQVQIDTSLMASQGKFDFLIVDNNILRGLGASQIPTFAVSATEATKNLETVGLILEKMHTAGLDRTSKVLVLGGGIVQDLATITCSLFMRGVGWVYEPTTLTGMMDSCLGGKSSINVGLAKNLIGNFYPPLEVNISVAHLKTLPKFALIDGVAEGVKICFARSEESFRDFLSSIPDPSEVGPSDLDTAIWLSLEAKKWFVEQDEFDKKERRLLNFGHTFGHALESASGFKISHGLSVALGMLAAIEFSGTSDVENVALLQRFCIRLLNPVSEEIQAKASSIDWEVFEKTIVADKKNTPGFLHLILPDSYSVLQEVMLPLDDELLQSASKSLKVAIERI